MLVGKRTYILAALGGLVTGAYVLGWIGQEHWQAIMGFIVSAAAATLKAGQVAESAKVMEKVQRVEDRECADKP